MPFCTQCSRPVGDSSRFCGACGAPVAAIASPDLSKDVTRTSSQASRTTPLSALPPSGPHGRFEPGTKLSSRYRVVALLGRGGMGEVYRADDLDLGQAVALKFLPSALVGDATHLARFRGEVRVARQIAHPNVCRVYDIGEANGHVFLSMEYIDGEDLASVLRRMGRPTSDKAIEIARQICHGLAAAHEAGMLHRDLKPANIMIDGRGRARITDFGLAGMAGEVGRDEEIAGTPAYMAPEQIEGGRVSARSDIYALGLVLYEVFTGKRALSATSLGEIKRMHESGTITTPSELVRDLDPAVERVILRCLERDPELRPPSAYAVLAALPGGDPLAAALAAGETPSPELVANAGDRGSLSPRTALALIAVGIVSLGLWAAVAGRSLRVLTKPTATLSVRADEFLLRTGIYDQLPTHTSESFDIDLTRARHELAEKPGRSDPDKAVVFWRRWSPRNLQGSEIHNSTFSASDPPLSQGQASVVLDPAGRLLALKAIPPDTARVVAGLQPDWNVLFEAAGLDPTAFSRVPLARPTPAVCDSTAAWTGPLPGSERATIQAGASHGRLVYFEIVRDWGTSAAQLNVPGVSNTGVIGWPLYVILVLVPLVGSIYFGARNLKLGRGDRRGATRIALFVFVMNMLAAAFTTRLSEDGLLAAATDWTFGRALAHSILHAVEIWFAYVAIEPYLRRLWPRMLVSWARLISGRPRDPLVGRDVLIGGTIGLALLALAYMITLVAPRLGLSNVPSLITIAVTSWPLTGYSLSISGSVCIINVLDLVVLILVFRLLFKRTWLAVLSCILLGSTALMAQGLPQTGLLLSAVVALVFVPGVTLTTMRFGLLPGVISMFVVIGMQNVVGTLDLSSWYADRALLPMALMVALLVYGAATALAGKPIFGDPLRDAPARPV